MTHRPFRSDIADLLSEDFVPEGWLSARVPEDIHTTLRRVGAIRGVTYEKQDAEDRWIEEEDWLYHRTFFVPEDFRGESVQLHFEGVDCFCEVYLNGVRVAAHENMHTPFDADVAGILRPGVQNRLLVRIFSAVKQVAGMDDTGIFSITDSDRIFARKAQMNYSWDFCGRCVTCGIWKPVTLVARSGPRLGDDFLYTVSCDEEKAVLSLSVPVEDDSGDSDAASGCEVRAALMAEGRVLWSWNGPAEKAADMTIELNHPRLWWPRLYGDAFLYDFSLTLSRGGVCLDRHERRFGIRTIRVVQ